MLTGFLKTPSIQHIYRNIPFLCGFFAQKTVGSCHFKRVCQVYLAHLLLNINQEY